MSKNHYIIPIFVPHKGCPFDCIFCNQKKITGVQGDISASQVVKTIEEYIKTISNKDADIEVAFYGGSFTGIPIQLQKKLLEAVQPFKNRNIIHHIRLSTRPDYIDINILKFLKEFNVTIIELGVQSMDDEVLTLSCRGHNREDVIKAASMIRESGFTLGLQMMIGLPGDTVKKMYYTANEIIKLKPDMVRIYPALVIKDTELEYLYRMDRYKPLELKAAVQICKKLLILFETNSIQVIRIGLQATETITQGKDVIAGPFHPAFRELVESEIKLDMLEWGIRQFSEIPHELEIHVNPKAVSEVVAVKKKNIKYLKNKFKFSKITIIQDMELKRDEMIVKHGIESCNISKKNFFNTIKNRRNFIANIE
jgi:histone acetyltransferase (RNA polymerase elongator complex component)